MVAPVLMKRDECVNIARAAHHSGKSDKTIRRWINRYGIGRQSPGGGPYQISLPGLEMVMHGDLAALEMLRDGRRTEPAVRRYLEFLGLPG